MKEDSTNTENTPDEGTEIYLDMNDSAVVLRNHENDTLIPEIIMATVSDTESVPSTTILAVAIGMRLRTDPDFANDCIEWFENMVDEQEATEEESNEDN